MAALQNGIINLKMVSLDHSLTGFYFNSSFGIKCLLLDPTLDKSDRTILLDDLLTSGAFREITYRELINPHDVRRFKLALVNMHNTFDMDRLSPDKDYATIYIDYMTKSIGQNPAERISQCEGSCYIGPVPDIPSYDPFDKPRLYHRNFPSISSSDKQRIEKWIKFYNQYYYEPITFETSRSLSLIINVIPMDTFFQSFLESCLDDGTQAGDPIPIKMPLSFRVPPEYIFPNHNEKMVTTWGLNIYDGSCWEIALDLLKSPISSLLDRVRSSRKTTQFASIISNNINSQRSNQYLSPIIIEENTIPTGVTDPTFNRTLVYPYDPDGFAFRLISNYYNYNFKTSIPEKWSPTSKHWNHFRPSCRENAWFYGISPYLRLSRSHGFIGYSGFFSTLFNMMDNNGGFYSSPLNSSNTTWSLSTEDNAAMYAALSHIKAHLEIQNPESDVVTLNPSLKINEIGQIQTMMNGIEVYFDSIADKDNYLLYQGKYWLNQWNINMGGVFIDTETSFKTTPFMATYTNVDMPTDCDQIYLISVNAHLWAICSLQPLILDKIFGEAGATLKMWTNLKNACGRFDIEGRLQGFGYTNVKSTFDTNQGSVISAEITFVAMLACKILKSYYGITADTSPYSIGLDLADMEAFMYTPNRGVPGDPHLLFVSKSEAYFNHVDRRSQTGLGAIVHPLPSITATAWHIFYIKAFNPFVPGGSLLR
jgi:hypothetical protein